MERGPGWRRAGRMDAVQPSEPTTDLVRPGRFFCARAAEQNRETIYVSVLGGSPMVRARGDARAARRAREAGLSERLCHVAVSEPACGVAGLRCGFVVYFFSLSFFLFCVSFVWVGCQGRGCSGSGIE